VEQQSSLEIKSNEAELNAYDCDINTSTGEVAVT